MRELKFQRLNATIQGLLIAVFVFSMLPASGLRISATYDNGGFSEDITATIDQNFASQTLLGEFGLSKTIIGNADLVESHFVSNMIGDYAEVGATITGATTNYVYSYELYPGLGANKDGDHVWATENLNVPDAAYINAYSRARNRLGDMAAVSTDVSSIGTPVSLLGYSNQAYAGILGGAALAEAGQSIGSASGQITTKTEVSTIGLTGNPKGKALGQFANIVPDARITTAITGSIPAGLGGAPGYSDSAIKQAGSAAVTQDGHITGSFTSIASATGAPDKTRTSNYGTDYDLHMSATEDLLGATTSGILGYYINPGMATATLGAIQGGVNAAEDGDTINMATGTYSEKVTIGKSLNLNGADMTSTVVDGGRTGTVFTISPGKTVNLARMKIQNGGLAANTNNGGGISNSGDLTLSQVWLTNNKAKYGGGIYNQGTLAMDQCTVTSNDVNVGWGQGGGIYNSGILTLSQTAINNNQAKPANFRYSAGGGGIFNSGTVNMDQDTSIASNTANYGGGIYNLGTASKLAIVNMNQGSSIANNIATGPNGGGGIYNEYYGEVNVNQGSSITGNKANSAGYKYGGGGILNGFYSTVNMDGGSIAGNQATYGGGISIRSDAPTYNFGTVNLNSGSITGNTATIDGGGIYNWFGYGKVNGDTSIVSGNTPPP